MVKATCVLSILSPCPANCAVEYRVFALVTFSTFCLQSWADAFRSSPSLSGVVCVYDDLKKRGLEFPMTDLDALSPIHTPNRVRLPTLNMMLNQMHGGTTVYLSDKPCRASQKMRLLRRPLSHSSHNHQLLPELRARITLLLRSPAMDHSLQNRYHCIKNVEPVRK